MWRERRHDETEIWTEEMFSFADEECFLNRLQPDDN